MTAPKPRFYTPDEAAVVLRVTKRTLQNWRRDGRGPASIKEGGVVLYPVSAIDAWEKRQLRGAA